MKCGHNARQTCQLAPGATIAAMMESGLEMVDLFNPLTNGVVSHIKLRPGFSTDLAYGAKLNEIAGYKTVAGGPDSVAQLSGETCYAVGAPVSPDNKWAPTVPAHDAPCTTGCSTRGRQPRPKKVTQSKI